MTTLELIFQSALFSLASFVALLALSIVAHYSLGRMAFALLVSAVCLAAELFAVFKLAQAIWRLSGRIARALLRVTPTKTSAPALLTEVKN